MPRQNLYFDDILDAVTGWRWRLILVPAYNQPLPASNGVPDFGVRQRFDTIYIPVPLHMTFRPPENDEAGFDERPVGALEMPTLKLTLDLSELKGGEDSNGDGISDWEDLRSYLVDQTYPNGGVLEGRYYDTSMLWILLTDRGNPSVVLSDFFPYFEGIQRKRPSLKYKIDRDEETIRLEAELVHLARIAPEYVIADDVATRLQNSPPVAPKRVRTTYEYLWQDAAHSMTLGHVREGPMDRPQQADMYRMVDLWYTLSTCVEDIMKSFTRTTASFTSQSARSVTVNARPVGSPIDVFLLYKQLVNEPSGGKGAVIAPDNLWFVGRVSWIDNEQYIGGFLRDDASGEKQESLWRWSNMWDFLISMSGPAKMQLKPTALHSVTMYWAGVQSYTGGSPTITADDFIGREVEFEQGANTLRGTSVEPAEHGSGTVAYKIRGLKAEPDHTTRLVFTNQPDNTPGNDQFDWLRYINISTRFATSISFLIVHGGFRPFGLYYFDVPGGTLTSSEICIRPHHYTAVDYGGAFDFSLGLTENIANPMIPIGSFNLSDPSFYEKYLWVPIKGNYQEMISSSCMAYATAVAITKQFQSPKQTLYSGTFPMSKVWWPDLGSLVDWTYFPSADMFLWPELAGTMAGIPGRPHVLRVQDNPAEATTKVELLAQG